MAALFFGILYMFPTKNRGLGPGANGACLNPAEEFLTAWCMKIMVTKNRELNTRTAVASRLRGCKTSIVVVGSAMQTKSVPTAESNLSTWVHINVRRFKYTAPMARQADSITYLFSKSYSSPILSCSVRLDRSHRTVNNIKLHSNFCSASRQPCIRQHSRVRCFNLNAASALFSSPNIMTQSAFDRCLTGHKMQYPITKPHATPNAPAAHCEK